MRLSASDYLDLVERKGLFPADTGIPELSVAVWRAFLALYAAHAGDVKDIDIVATDDGLAFYRDPLMGEETWSWALTSPLSHPVLPWSPAHILAAVPDIAALCADEGIAPSDLVTDSFDTLAPPSNDEARHFAWLNSPVAQFGPSFEHYVEGLAAPRRKQARRLYRQYDDDPAIRFDFSDRPPDGAEFDFVAGNTLARWGEEEAPFALTQTLWVIAAAQAMPDAARFMRVHRGDALIYFNSYVIRRGVVTSQATCRKEGETTSGLGVMIDFKTIETMTGNTLCTALDPTCMTGIVDPGSILVAKREVVNAEARKPVFVLDNGRVPGAPRFTDGRWDMPAEPLVLGRGV